MAVTAFRQTYNQTDLVDPTVFEQFAARELRYRINWAYYEGSAFNKLQPWTSAYKVQFGLYRAVRQIYDPAARLGNFWQSFNLGGPLDEAAGDGLVVPSALPILTENQDLRPVIASIWKYSRWQIWKDVLSLHGAVLGDAVLMADDDPDKQRVAMRVVHPAKFKAIEIDSVGNVKGYVFEEKRPDPSNQKDMVLYTEIATRDGENVAYQTLRDNRPFDWTGFGSTYSVPYGFIPMVMLQHQHVGLDWGWSEFHEGEGLFREVDDVASALHDHVRRNVNAPWLLAGVQKPENESGSDKVKASNRKLDRKDPEAEREEAPLLYGPVGAQAHALVTNLNIEAVTHEIAKTLDALEKIYPELNVDPWDVEGTSVSDPSGIALEVIRQPAERKVRTKRVVYDDAIVRMHKMLISIGALKQYPGFDKFNETSFADGKLDHQIGDRPVFNTGELAKLERDKLFWTVAKAATDTKVPLIAYLQLAGWSEERIQKITNSPEWQSRIKLLEQLGNNANNPTQPPSPSPSNQSGRGRESAPS